MRNQIISTVSAVVLATMFAAPSFATTYTDDAAIGDWSKESVAILESLGIMTGYPDGSFKPSNNLTREEYAVSLLNGLATLESLVTEAYQAEDAYLYEQLVAQQVTLLEALTAIDEIKAKDAVEHNNYFALGLGYGVSNSNTDDVSNVQLLGKIQVVELSNKFAISIRPFVMSDATAGTTATVDFKATDKLGVYVGGGAAANWSNGGQLNGANDEVVGIAQAGVEYDLSKTTVAGIDVKVPVSGDNSDNPVVTGLIGVKF